MAAPATASRRIVPPFFSRDHQTGLTSLLSQTYNKPVTLNLIKLQRPYLEADILSQHVVQSLKDRKNSPRRVIRDAAWKPPLPTQTTITAQRQELLQRAATIKAPTLETLKIGSDVRKTGFMGVRDVLKDLALPQVSSVAVEAAGRLSQRITANRAQGKVARRGLTAKGEEHVIRGAEKANTTQGMRAGKRRIESGREAEGRMSGQPGSGASASLRRSGAGQGRVDRPSRASTMYLHVDRDADVYMYEFDKPGRCERAKRSACSCPKLAEKRVLLRSPLRFTIETLPNIPTTFLSPTRPMELLTTEMCRDALEHHGKLKEGLEELVSSNPWLADLDAHLVGLDIFPRKLVHPKYYNERRKYHSTIAQRTFDIPELLELILGYLDIDDLLAALRVNHQMRSAIESSTKIQERLCFRPSKDAFLCLPFAKRGPRHSSGFRCRLISPRVAGCIKADFSVLVGQRLTPISPTVRRMLICQPPIKEMTVAVKCCGVPWPKDWREAGLARTGAAYTIEPATITAAGLTIGDLYDCAWKVISEHRYCLHASHDMLDEDGCVKAQLCFVGDVLLEEDDPLAMKDRRLHRDTKVLARKEKEKNRGLSAYIQAKHTAHDNGRPVPTLKKFRELASDPHWDWARGRTGP